MSRMKNIHIYLPDFKHAALTEAVRDYFEENKKLLDEIYFKPKGISFDLLETKLRSNKYYWRVRGVKEEWEEKGLKEWIGETVAKFGKAVDMDLYVIVGLDTSTVYSTTYKGKPIAVLLLESTQGNADQLEILLAHEYAHAYRRKTLKAGIFNASLGERIATEGLACVFSEDRVPGYQAFDYCLVPEETAAFVKDKKMIYDMISETDLKAPEKIPDFFSKGADKEKTGMPARTGYVYGYLKVKEYLAKNPRMKITDALSVPWEKIVLR